MICGPGLTGRLLTSASRRRQALWLAVLCPSPTLGVAITEVGVPERLEPVLVATAVGVLGQAARRLVTAICSRRASAARPAAALLAAGLVTTPAVYGVG